MSIELWQVDAFADRAFAGNPAGVCVPEASVPDPWQQALATEMNLSETAFLRPRQGDWDLRWFTPVTEVDLCGHATLASAHILWETGRADPGETIRFHTRSGLLTAVRRDDWIELDFPALPPEEAEPVVGLAEALGARIVWTGRSRFDVLALLENADQVRNLTPDLGALARVDARGVMVTAPGDVDGVDFVSRFFAPRFGVPEDPVTGSAHCCLGPYWGSRLGKRRLTARQVSARGGTVRLELRGDRVGLSGQAVTVMRVDLLPPALSPSGARPR